MLAFVSLFLGLVLGPHQLKVFVGAPVVKVEIFLDGTKIAEMSRGPWEVPIDFGTSLAPHRLEAVGRDAAGREVTRISQRINLPRRVGEAVLFLEPGAGGEGRVARLTWQSIVGEQPKRVAVTFDGRPIPVTDPRRIAIPRHVPEQLHFLRAELDFDDHVSAVADLVWGGRYADRTQAEMTAVPVELGKVKELPAPDKMTGWFLAEGRPIGVTAVEKGPADVVVVLDVAARPEITRLLYGAQGPKILAMPGQVSSPDQTARLGKEQRVRFVLPVPETRLQPGLTYVVFPRSEDFTRKDGGLLSLAARARLPVAAGASQKLAEAVGVAALSAVERNRSRAVVLVTTARPVDDSDLAPRNVRRYLDKLRVPFFVWCVDEDPSPLKESWGDAVAVSSPSRFESQVVKLSRLLDRQNIVWVEGVHLPQQVSLSAEGAANAGIRLAGGDTSTGCEPAPASGEALGVFGTRIRRDPDEASAAVGVLDGDVSLPILERCGDWLRVRYGEYKGWMRAGDDQPAARTSLEPLDPYVPGAAPTSDAARRLLRFPAERAFGPYRLLTDVEDETLISRLETIAERVEGWYANRYGIEPSPPAGDMVAMFAKHGEYTAFAELQGDGADADSPGLASGGLAAFRLSSSEIENRHVLIHELVHLANRRAFSSPLPRWLEEGMADDLAWSRSDARGRLETRTFTSEDATRAGMRVQGGARATVRLFLDRSKSSRIPLGTLMGMDREAFTAPNARPVSYPESALFVRFLLEAHEDDTKRWLGSLRRGGSASEAALLAALHLRRKDLEAGFEAWLARLRL